MDFSYCYACGENSGYTTTFPLDDELINTWKLSPNLASVFNIREGLICNTCGSNKRAQSLAYAILISRYGYGAKNLKQWVIQANKKKLRVCELNSCHKLHDIIKGLDYLTFAEYGTKTEEDIQKLSYDDNSFDLVLHSETLEHVDNPVVSMEECRRVIKPEGIVLFTIPFIWNRKTLKRNFMSDGKIVKILKPSYHGYKTDDYLVHYEYGRDCLALLKSRVFTNNYRVQCFVLYSDKLSKKEGIINIVIFRLKEYLVVRKGVR